jgi:hypothetical protein
VRKQAGIGFPGVTSTDVSRIGRVRLPDELIVSRTGEVEVPGFGRVTPIQRSSTPRGNYSLAPLASLDKNAERGIYIVWTNEDNGVADADGPMTLDELRDSFRRVVGADLPMSDPQWLTRTVGNSRQADRYRTCRVMLAGDAAHLVGIGGSLNVGLLDTVNLGWKLAAVTQGLAQDALLDSYHSERHLAGQRALMQARAQRALSGRDEYAGALREVVAELLRYREPVRHVGELLEGSDVRYPMPGGGTPPHPLLGGLAPDLRVKTGQGRTSVAELLHPARGVLLDFTPDRGAAQAAAGWSDRVTVVTGQAQDPPAPALLLRPDGIVAWLARPREAGHSTARRKGAEHGGLAEALGAWFGQPVTR